MRDPYGDIFTVKPEIFRVNRSYLPAINVAVYCSQGLKVTQFGNYIQGAYIPGMPYFITRIKMLKDPVVEVTVGV